MADHNFSDRTLALAGIFQAAKMVKDVAWYGKCPPRQLEVAIQSLLTQNAATTKDIFAGAKNLTSGLNELIKLFDEPKSNTNNEITRYALSMVHLERTLSKRSDMLDTLKNGLQRAKSQSEIFSLTHDNVIANIAGIYTDTISTFRFRIHVTGEPNILNNMVNANRVRALLLFGIRSAVLWRQLGGSRWQILLSKKKYIHAARTWLQQVEYNETTKI